MGYPARVETRAYVESTQRCNNACAYIRILITTIDKDLNCYGVAKCLLYNRDLTWDRRYTSNGYRRCKECKKGVGEYATG